MCVSPPLQGLLLRQLHHLPQVRPAQPAQTVAVPGFRHGRDRALRWRGGVRPHGCPPTCRGTCDGLGDVWALCLWGRGVGRCLSHSRSRTHYWFNAADLGGQHLVHDPPTPAPWTPPFLGLSPPGQWEVAGARQGGVGPLFPAPVFGHVNDASAQPIARVPALRGQGGGRRTGGALVGPTGVVAGQTSLWGCSPHPSRGAVPHCWDIPPPAPPHWPRYRSGVGVASCCHCEPRWGRRSRSPVPSPVPSPRLRSRGEGDGGSRGGGGSVGFTGRCAAT